MDFIKNNKEKEAGLRDIMNPSGVPILTLDKKWHDLFLEYEKTMEILKVEEQVNTLLKEQGSLTTRRKELSVIKKKLMNKIMVLTTEAFENNNQNAKKEMELAQQQILVINEEFEKIEERLLDLPYELKETNFVLFEKTVKLVYSNLREDQHTLKEIEEYMLEMRRTLREKIETKVLLEEKIKKTYAYFHDMLGADSTELLDKNLL